MSSSESPFWNFTLAIYKREGVSPACIGLQDRLGLDVNFLLLCLFAGSRGQALTSADFARLEAAAAPWRRNVIHPLRGVRRWLREQTLLPKETTDGIRRAVLTQEIESEGQQQRLMEAALPAAEGRADLAAAAGNLVRYLASAGTAAGPEETASLSLLLAQAFPPTTIEMAGAALNAARVETTKPASRRE